MKLFILICYTPTQTMDVNKSNIQGETALSVASEQGHIESVKTLLGTDAGNSVDELSGCSTQIS